MTDDRPGDAMAAIGEPTRAALSLVVCSLEPWTEVRRRLRILVDEMVAGDPELRVLYVTPPVDPLHQLRTDPGDLARTWRSAGDRTGPPTDPGPATAEVGTTGDGSLRSAVARPPGSAGGDGLGATASRPVGQRRRLRATARADRVARLLRHHRRLAALVTPAATTGSSRSRREDIDGSRRRRRGVLAGTGAEPRSDAAGRAHRQRRRRGALSNTGAPSDHLGGRTDGRLCRYAP